MAGHRGRNNRPQQTTPNNGGDNNNMPSATGEVDGANSQSMSQASTGSSEVGVAAVVAVNIVNADNRAAVSGNASLTTLGDVVVGANSHVDAITKAVGTAIDLGGDSTNIGAAVSVSVADVDNQAVVGPGVLIDANDVRVVALNKGDEVNEFIAWAAAAGRRRW